MTIFSTKAQRRIDLVLAARHVPAKLLELEPTLIRRRWPGYNFTGQLELTQEFMRAYDDRFYSAFKVEISITREIDHPEFLTVWHMRQAADWWPIPYADYLTIAFTLARTKVERFMVPHLRYLRNNTNRNLLKKLKKDAPRERAAFFRTDWGPQFSVLNYCGLPGQDRFHEVAIDYALRSKDWRSFIEELVLYNARITPASVLSAMPRRADLAEAMRQVREAHQDYPRGTNPSVRTEPHELWQTCFAVPGACNMNKLPCSRCPVAESCVRAAAIISRAAALKPL